MLELNIFEIIFEIANNAFDLISNNNSAKVILIAATSSIASILTIISLDKKQRDKKNKVSTINGDVFIIISPQKNQKKYKRWRDDQGDSGWFDGENFYSEKEVKWK